jgi:hypothetical protein
MEKAGEGLRRPEEAGSTAMTWETFYMICFLVGLMLSAVSLLGGMGHFGGHVHIPHAHVPHVHVPHGVAHAGQIAKAGVGRGGTVPWWNTFSIMVFLCWFGAAGYLLTHYGVFVTGVVFVLAGICGLAGGWIVFIFLAKVLMPHERELTAEETEVTGVVGRVTSPIRSDGTGEMVYEQLGARRSAPARAEDGEAIARDEEVFVVRYEKGIAYVRRWEEEASGQWSVISGQNAGKGKSGQ